MLRTSLIDMETSMTSFFKTNIKNLKAKRGYKICPHCHEEIPSASKKCQECNKEISKKDTEQFKAKQDKERRKAPEEILRFGMAVGFISGPVVYGPSGPVPAKLKSTTKKSVVEWAELVIDAGLQQGKLYTPHAIKYFLGQFYIHGTEEYKKAAKIIDRWASQLVKSTKNDN